MTTALVWGVLLADVPTWAVIAIAAVAVVAVLVAVLTILLTRRGRSPADASPAAQPPPAAAPAPNDRRTRQQPIPSAPMPPEAAAPVPMVEPSAPLAPEPVAESEPEPLAEAPPLPEPEPEPAQADPPAIVFTDGPLEGKRVEVTRELVLGREDVDVLIEDPEVSRRHAGVRPGEKGLMIDDLGSSNGTFVNGLRVRETAPLQDGDVIRIGRVALRIEIPPPPPAPPPAPPTVVARDPGATVVSRDERPPT